MVNYIIYYCSIYFRFLLIVYKIVQITPSKNTSIIKLSVILQTKKKRWRRWLILISSPIGQPSSARKELRCIALVPLSGSNSIVTNFYEGIDNKHVFYDNQQYFTYKVVTNIVVSQGVRKSYCKDFTNLGNYSYIFADTFTGKLWHPLFGCHFCDELHRIL